MADARAADLAADEGGLLGAAEGTPPTSMVFMEQEEEEDDDDEAESEAMRKRKEFSRRALEALRATRSGSGKSTAGFLFKAPSLPALRIESNGHHVVVEMEREDLISEARKVVPKLRPLVDPVPMKTKEDLLASLDDFSTDGAAVGAASQISTRSAPFAGAEVDECATDLGAVDQDNRSGDTDQEEEEELEGEEDDDDADEAASKRAQGKTDIPEGGRIGATASTNDVASRLAEAASKNRKKAGVSRADSSELLEKGTSSTSGSTVAVESLPQFMRIDKRETQKLTFRGTLQPRDIRLFDPGFSTTHDPEILVRRHAVLMNLDTIKALVLYNKCFIFVPDGSDSLMGSVLMHMRDFAEETPGAHFEMRAYEAVLETVCSKIETEYTKHLKPAIDSSIAEVLQSMRGPILEKLRQVQARLDALEARVSALHKAISELLRSDSDMALMQLTKSHKHPERYLTGNEDEWAFDHDEIELMLENYLQIIDGVQIGIRDLDEGLDSARSTTSLRLSTAQNRLLGVDLLVSGVTAASTIGALIAGLFGMNLASGVAEDPHWFWGVFGSVCICLPCVMFAVLLWIRSRGLLIT